MLKYAWETYISLKVQLSTQHVEAGGYHENDTQKDYIDFDFDSAVKLAVVFSLRMHENL